MQTKQPFGVRPLLHTSGKANPRQQFGLVDSAPAKTLAQNLPIVINSSTGVITPISQGATYGTEEVFAIFAGLQYVDGTGMIKERPIILAGTPLWGNSAVENTGPATNSVSAPYLYQDSQMEFEVQVNGTLSRSAIGQTFSIDMSTINDINTAVGYSQCMLYATPVPAGAGQFIITQLSDLPGNTWSDPFPIVRVKFNNIL